jgi:hypothetical protein
MPATSAGMTVQKSEWFDSDACIACAPGAAQHEAQRSDALQNRGRRKLRSRNGPGPAVHHFVLHRIRGTPSQNGSTVMNSGTCAKL